jgi:hypothetical protein
VPFVTKSMSRAADLGNGLKPEREFVPWDADDSQISGLIQPGGGPAAQPNAMWPGRGLQDGRQVGIKLGLCFGLLIAILLGTAYLALDRMQRAYASLQAELDESMLELQLAQDGMRYSSENSRIIMELFLVRRPEVIDQLLAHRAENSRKITALIPLLEVRCASDKEKRLLQTVKETRAAYTDSYQQFLHLLLIEKNREAAAELMVAQTLPALFRYHNAWDEFAWFQFDEVRKSASRVCSITQPRVASCLPSTSWWPCWRAASPYLPPARWPAS